MMLAAGCGSTVRVIASGEGSEAALSELDQLIRRKFDED